MTPEAPPWVRWTLLLCAALLGAYAARALTGLGGDSAREAFAGVVYPLVKLLGVLVLAARVARPGPDRAAWAMLTAGFASSLLGDAAFVALVPDGAAVSVADPFFLVAYVPMFLGAALLTRGRMHGVRSGLWADGLLSALAVATVFATVVLEPIRAAHQDEATLVFLVNVAYPLGDLSLLAGFVACCALRGWRMDARWAVLCLGSLSYVISDGFLALAMLEGTYVPGGLLEVGWLAPVVALAYVAWVPAAQTRAASSSPGAIVMPVVFGLAGATAFLLEALESKPDHVVVALGFATTVAVFGRFVLTSRDNLRLLATTHEEATTDPLTGLGNRRRLATDLGASGAGARALVIFDLDGFKHYNDTFGHPAGDGLLRLIGETLASAVAGRGGAYRMGGDEFCALVAFDGPDADAVGADLAAAMRQTGPGFSIGASFGTVRLPDEAATPEDALRLADRRMYARKHSRRASPDRQSTDVLLAIVAERDPGLGRHADQVAAMAVAVAYELGIGEGEELEIIRRAAELHDIGKVAVPEPVLNKPGPLDPDETALMRQHTVIGERILTAAPALAPVGRLVRSSHERWDGTGYPDGRAGADIPLGARIVFVCDAFDAMVSERPYSDDMAPDEALAEIVRCAGTQFDPRVVAAFAAVMSDRAVPA